MHQNINITYIKNSEYFYFCKTPQICVSIKGDTWKYIHGNVEYKKCILLNSPNIYIYVNIYQ